jgi:hypothetical protein
MARHIGYQSFRKEGDKSEWPGMFGVNNLGKDAASLNV